MVHKTQQGYNESKIFKREQARYRDLSLKFVTTKNDYSKQFSHVYSARLDELRDLLIPRVQAKWGKVSIAKLADLENLEEQQCIIIGTLYKHQQWKPSILRELSEDHQLAILSSRPNYCSEKDQLFLEDEMLRIKLVGEQIDLKQMCTGVVCAVLGNENSDGTFMVKDWCFPGCVPRNSLKECNSKGKLVIISGLNLSDNCNSLGTALFVEWLCGMAGNTTVQKDSATIVRLVIAGNTLGAVTDTAKESTEIMKIIDTFLSNLAMCCCVTLMPGEYDPTNAMLPQRPFHPCLLPTSARLESFKSTTNPWISKIEEQVIVGTSGQSIQDMVKVTGETDLSPLNWLEKTLVWRHLCPTAPDTLPSCPYYKKDLFIMEECPDIYFVGNTEKFETKLWKGDEGQTVRLISVPSFSKTSTAVIVNLANLDAQYISFGNT